MPNILKIAENLNIVPLLLAIQKRPHLWNQFTTRKCLPGTPHAEMSDIWVRYRSFDDFDPDNPADFVAEHTSVWYPAYQELPELRSIIFPLMAMVEAVQLGGVIITKIPQGCAIKPHTDRGWHPEFYDTKLYVPLMGNPKSGFRVGDEVVSMRPGEVWWLDNTVEHEVWNDGDSDRMTLIICTRR